MRQILIVVLMLAIVPTQAQIGFRIGLLGGPQDDFLLNKSNKDSSWLKAKPTMAYHIGASLGYNFHKNWGLEMNVLWAADGQNYSVARTGTVAKDSLAQINYIKVPFMARYTTNPDRRVRFVAMAGLQVSVLTVAVNYINHQPANETYSPPGLTYSNFFLQSQLFGVVYSGIDVLLTKNLIFGMGLRFDSSIMGVQDKNFMPNKNAASTYDMTLGLQFGISYHFKHQESASTVSPQNYPLKKEKSSKRNKSKRSHTDPEYMDSPPTD